MDLTDVQQALLLGDRLEVSAGCEVLDLDLNVTGDISDELIGGTVSRDMNNRIHGSCRLQLTTELVWGAALVRPYMILSDGTSTEQFNVGAYMLTTPEKPIGQTPSAFSAAGLDRLYLLDREVGEDYTVAEGGNYYDALVQVFVDAGLVGVLIDGSAAELTVPLERVWPLVGKSTDPDQTSTPVTWLRIVNDLLTAVNFQGVWADQNGIYRCQRYQAPADRASDFTFDADDPAVSIVGEDRTLVADTWKTPNRWVFIRTNLPTGDPPATEGAGIYTVDNLTDGPTSQTERGLVWPKVYTYEAASQDVLEELGNRRVAQDLRGTTTFKVTTGPFPVAGHYDVFTYVDADAGGSRKVVATEWDMDLQGSDVRWTWEEVG